MQFHCVFFAPLFGYLRILIKWHVSVGIGIDIGTIYEIIMFRNIIWLSETALLTQTESKAKESATIRINRISYLPLEIDVHNILSFGRDFRRLSNDKFTLLRDKWRSNHATENWVVSVAVSMSTLAMTVYVDFCINFIGWIEEQF